MNAPRDAWVEGARGVCPGRALGLTNGGVLLGVRVDASVARLDAPPAEPSVAGVDTGPRSQRIASEGPSAGPDNTDG